MSFPILRPILRRFKNSRLLGVRILAGLCVTLLLVWVYFLRRGHSENVLLDITDFEYVVTPEDICTSPKHYDHEQSKSNPKTILIFVHSARENFLSRQIVRETFGSVKKYQDWDISLVFLLGLEYVEYRDEKIETMLEKEVEAYGDILMGTFPDTYRHLSYKHLMGYKFVSEFCPTVGYYLKSDDDTLVDIFHVIMFLERIQHPKSLVARLNTSFYYCKLQLNGKPVRPGERNGTLKEFELTEDEFQDDTFPPYCGFSTYLTKIDTVKKMYEVSTKVKFLFLEDVFTTGIMRDYYNQHIAPTPKERINLIPGNIFDYGYEKGNIFQRLGRTTKDYLAIIVEERDPSVTCRLWRKLHQIHGLTKLVFGACETLLPGYVKLEKSPERESPPDSKFAYETDSI